MIVNVCRNLSCSQKKERQAMRQCRGLIDSLMNYVQSCVAEENPDDKVRYIFPFSHEDLFKPKALPTDCIIIFSVLLLLCKLTTGKNFIVLTSRYLERYESDKDLLTCSCTTCLMCFSQRNAL